MTRPLGLLMGLLLGLPLALALAVGAAHADPDLFSPQAFAGSLDLRAAGADGQTSWIQGGFGKTRFGGKDGAFDDHAAIADAALVWKPQLSWAWSALIDAEYQAGQQHPVDLVQAYLSFKPTPKSDWRYSARFGLFYPEISLEHGGPEWNVTDTITPSAINSWVGEEVKVVGGEAKVSHALGSSQVSATAGLFGFNDTSGTLLAFRGWALHDLKSGAFGRFKLPPLDTYMIGKQPPFTSSTIELDGNVGYYGRLEWRPPGRAVFSAFYYANRGDKISDNADLEWAWDTRFWNLGASYDIDDMTRLQSQVMWGHELMGYPNGRSVWINIDYLSAYAMASRRIGLGTLSGRAEYFQTRDQNFRPATDDADDNRGETGWALTAAWRYDLTAHAQVFLEALHVHSDRPSLIGFGLDPHQSQTQVQTSLRLSL